MVKSHFSFKNVKIMGSWIICQKLIISIKFDFFYIRKIGRFMVLFCSNGISNHYLTSLVLYCMEILALNRKKMSNYPMSSCPFLWAHCARLRREKKFMALNKNTNYCYWISYWIIMHHTSLKRVFIDLPEWTGSFTIIKKERITKKTNKKLKIENFVNIPH